MIVSEYFGHERKAVIHDTETPNRYIVEYFYKEHSVQKILCHKFSEAEELADYFANVGPERKQVFLKD